MTELKKRGRLPFTEPPGHPDANRNFHTCATEWVWQNYFHGLGYLMHSYARVEADLNVTINGLVKENLREKWSSNQMTEEERRARIAETEKKDAIMQALLGASRPATAMQTLRRLLRVMQTAPETLKRVEEILTHFSAIGSLRDRLAHIAPLHDQSNKDQWFYISNQFLVNENSKVSTYRFQSEMLVRAAWDLANIPDYLYEVLHPIDYSDQLIAPCGPRPSQWEVNGGWSCKPSELTPPQATPKQTKAKKGPKS